MEIWPIDPRSERLAYYLVAIALSAGLAYPLSHLLAFCIGLLWALWFLWMLVLQPIIFPAKPELSPQDEAAAMKEAWAESMSTIDPTTLKMMQRDLLALQRSDEEKTRRIQALEVRKVQ